MNEPPTPLPPSRTRLGGTDAACAYHCARCGAPIGGRDKIAITDKFDRVYCSDSCYAKARDHPSWEYESRGGDY